jgi:NAD-dependent dihydropyrimidine dehydrogenase PreA subunit
MGLNAVKCSSIKREMGNRCKKNGDIEVEEMCPQYSHRIYAKPKYSLPVVMAMYKRCRKVS